MSNCFDALERKPALAIGLSVLTLGILPIGYLGYRLVQWISNTEAFAKVNDCFKKYFCCCLPRRNEPNIRLVGNSDEETEATEGQTPTMPLSKPPAPKKKLSWAKPLVWPDPVIW